jgi:heme oxygenase
MVFAHLKQHTHTQHIHLEQTIDIANQIQNEHQYRDVLAAFYGFYKPLEERLDTIQGLEIINFKARHKVGLLQRDLTHLGLSESEIEQLPLCMDLPHVESLAEALGCLYVLEGSTLGGQIISRHLQELPHSFFTSYGSQVGKLWTELKIAAEQFAHEPHSYDVLTTAAQDTFAKLDHWFQHQISSQKDSL